ncbi:MAG TPA: chloride channel protein [Gemmatimonadales bacterium]|nr:chloride channel protein [Gemmatimonadales bacterium]
MARDPVERSLLNRLLTVQQAPRALSRALALLGGDEHALLLTLAVVIGAAAGVAVIGFYLAIDLVQRLVLHTALFLPLPVIVLIPLFVAIGLIACRALVRWGARGSGGENIPDVMYRVTVKGGVIPLHPVLAKTLAAGLVIGTGGSVGAEGPVVVLGAATGSRIGRWLKATPNRLRTLVGCGAAAGISAAFNAPIAGVIFGIEKILGAAGGIALAPFVVASIIAATVGRAAFGDHPVLALPTAFSVGSAWELLLYAGLGVLCGVVAVLYSRAVWRTQDLLARFPAAWMRVAAGALVVGALDVAFRADLWGHGHQSLDLGGMMGRTAILLLALAGAKLIATAATFGAGGVGGVFTPALYIGATLGAAYGVASHQVLPMGTESPNALAVVGMAGLVAGATHAPLTAIMMVFEMTGDYGLIIPLMLTSVLAYGVARRLHPESVYTEWLVRRGVVLSQGADAAVMARVAVSECMNPNPAVIQADAPLEAVRRTLQEGRQTDFPVVDATGVLVGMVSAAGLREAAEDGDTPEGLILAADLATPEPDPVTTDDTLLTALRRFARRDADALPVVDSARREHLVGLVTRQDVLSSYERALTAEGGH